MGWLTKKARDWFVSLFQGVVDVIVGLWNMLIGAFNTVVSAIGGLWSAFIDIVKLVCNWVTDWIIYVAKAIYNFFLDEEKGIVWKTVDTLLEWGEWFIEQLPDLSFGEYSSTISTVMELVSKLDKFVPLSEAITLLGIFLAFVAIFLVVKLILKLIPTIG